MRIGVDASCLWNRRGFGRFVQELLGALLQAEEHHDYILLVDREPAAGEVPAECEVVNALPSRPVNESAVAGDHRSLKDMRCFTRAVRRLKPDLFFFPAVYSYFPLPIRTRSVVCFHDTIAETYPDLVFPDRKSRMAWNAKARLAVWQATRIMTVSSASRRLLIEHFGLNEDKVDVVTEGADSKFAPLGNRGAARRLIERFGISAERPFLLYVGGMSPHKNLEALLRAMPRVLREVDATLVLVGDPKADRFLANYEDLLDAARSDELLRERFLFTGFVTDAELVALYNLAYALVLPSLLEGFGLPAVEAMACGTPVLASHAGSLPEVVGPAGLFFSPHDEYDIARQLISLLSRPDLRDMLAGRATERASQFSWHKGAQDTLRSFARAVS